MACLSANTDITGWTVETTNCRFVIKDAAGLVFLSMDMGVLVAEDLAASGGLLISEGDIRKQTLTATQKAAFGLTADGLNAAAGQCRIGAAGAGGTGGGDTVPREFEGGIIFDIAANEYKWLEITTNEDTGAKTYVYYDEPNGTVVAAPTGGFSKSRDDTAGTITPTQADIAASATSVLLLAANPLRTRATIVNNNTAVLRISNGDNADLFDAPISQDEVYVEERFKGDIYGIWEAGFTAGQGARVNEQI